ncbi:MAG: hypothetical protein JSV95_08845 [Gemmatimonadota bacterium]|jgi:hypothetical protein|nr:MAG: hypothetical protein JSV95_08845 [Gemmatimonadota bacterium]
MSDGLDRRTFVRGAAGAIGVGAVGGFTPALGVARVSSRAGQEATDVVIPVTLVQTGRSTGRGRPRQWKLSCPPAEASPGEVVEWRAQPGLTIDLVQFKGGRSPFAMVDLPAAALANAPNRTVRTDAAGRYDYLIVASDADRTYALDPPLDIVPATTG